MKTSTALLMMAALSGLSMQSSDIASFSLRELPPRKRQMILTDEELEILNQLKGKEKKAYVRDLKKKYLGGA
jgi:hypothetical protein